MKTYHGYRRVTPGLDKQPVDIGDCIVRVCTNGRKRYLRPRQDIANHSPAGFEWGFCGSGPAQLALALVADCMGKKYAVPAVYQRIKECIVAKLAHDGWPLPEADLRHAITFIRIDRGEL